MMIEMRRLQFNLEINVTALLKYLQSGHFYSDEIKLKTPKAVERWEEPGQTDTEWERIFLIPYRCTKSTDCNLYNTEYFTDTFQLKDTYILGGFPRALNACNAEVRIP